MTITKKYTSWKALSGYETDSQRTKPLRYDEKPSSCIQAEDSFKMDKTAGTYIPTGLERFMLKYPDYEARK